MRFPAEAQLINGADHVFNAFKPKDEAPQRVIDATLAWLARTL